ncbi:MAG: hypothetical protein ABIQ44_05610, partial [Chloroflexia bacterium]
MARKQTLLAIAQLSIFAILGSVVGAAAQAPLGVLAQAATNQAQVQAPQSTRDFEDISPANTFFNNIRSLYFAGVVTGYPCGGPGEPCGPENLPYYRPGALVNRAQMAKFADLVRKSPGIFIDTTNAQPIYARTSANNGRAIQGDSILGNGIHGVSSGGAASGVYGENVSGGFGVAGRSNGAGSAIYGDNTNGSGFAGYFNGNVRVQGTLSKAAGSFEIDNPIDPANKYLYHSFVESPDMMNVYNGNVVVDAKGEATVQLPDYFGALNQDFRYQLTAIGAPGPNLYVAEEISGNQFKIAGASPNSKVSWQVTGIRHDPYAEQNRIQPVVDKPTDEKGKYL